MFFIGGEQIIGKSILSSIMLTAFVLIGVAMTFIVSAGLSNTVLKGIPSSFTLELPPFRRPQISKVIVRSVFDRIIFVLGRSIVVAAPAGIIIWIAANVNVGSQSMLLATANWLDPFARLMGLDGIMLLAFILGIPANEIVIPIAIMAYMSGTGLVSMGDLSGLRELLVSNGWTHITAVCTMLFSILHWPCSTTLITVYKETKSIKWSAAAFFIPTVCGILICMAVNAVMLLIG